ncbi:hypothetical protein ABZ863_07840 [Saccharomonospora sp. NPDC046836]|uniref:hypothetical protein n=1 Tax=Saccharomonospora sp. NPDC046836 TaxID=3156921 RepID=UPI0033DC334A
MISRFGETIEGMGEVPDEDRVFPVRFVPYGVAGWTGSRRLDFWQRSSDQSRANQVWLGHGSKSGSVVVGTFDPRDRLAGSRDLAEELVIKLVNIGLPGPDVPRPAGFGRRLVRHAMDLVAQRENWPTVPVTVDGGPAHLRYQRFAAGWAGTVEGYSLGAFGTGDRPAQLALVRVADTSAYGFDVAAGVRLADLTADEDWVCPGDWHPDHQPLL